MFLILGNLRMHYSKPVKVWLARHSNERVRSVSAASSSTASFRSELSACVTTAVAQADRRMAVEITPPCFNWGLQVARLPLRSERH